MKKPYLEFSQEGIDQEYRVTGNIEGLERLFQGFVDDSEAFRLENNSYLNVSFGTNDEEVLDIFPPQGGSEKTTKQKAPVHIFIHGGYWYQFSKNEWSFLAEGLTRNDVMFVVPNYSLCPASSVSEIAQQMHNCVRWIYNNIEQYGGDPSEIYISGHSAGGHLAVMLLLTDWEKDYGLPQDIIKAVLSISGIFDISPVQKCYLQEFVQLSDEEVNRFNLALRIQETVAPLELFVGGEETAEFIRQSREFAQDWREYGNISSDFVMDGHNHISILKELSSPEGQLCKAALLQISHLSDLPHKRK